MGERVTVEGFVTYIHANKGESSKGPWTSYSVKLVDAAGVEDPLWYRFGFEAPGFRDDRTTENKGDYIRFEADLNTDGKSAAFVEGTGDVIVKNLPARTIPEKKGSGSGPKRSNAGGARPKTKHSDLFGEIGGYNTEDDIRRITLASVREAAQRQVTLLLSADALPLTRTTGKANVAVRYAESDAAVNKLTVQYFIDQATGRVLEDATEEEKAGYVAPLPDDVAVAAEPEPEPAAPAAEPEPAPAQEPNRKF